MNTYMHILLSEIPGYEKDVITDHQSIFGIDDATVLTVNTRNEGLASVILD